MKRIFLIPTFLIILFFYADNCFARELHKYYRSIRCLGTGGACIGIVNDETALVVNPAALGKLRNFYGTIIDPEVEINTTASQILGAHTSVEPFTLESVKTYLDTNQDKNYHARAQLFPSLVAQNFGIGILASNTLDATESSTASTIDAFYRSDVSFILGYNLRFFDGRIKLGVNTKLISRIEVDNTALSTTGALDYKSIASEGVGLSTDVGLILTAPWTLLPSISVVARDMGGTSFNQASGVRMTSTSRPQTVAQDIDAAFSFFPIHSNRVRSAFTIEYDGLLTASTQTDKAKLMHAGMEFNFGDLFFLRGGYNQRYWTAGMELASEHLQFQLASYGEEVGDETNQIEDRRYTLKVAWRF